MVAITGASGNTGSVIAEKLLERGEKVRVIGRDAKRLARFVQKGAEAFVADVTDAAALANGPPVGDGQAVDAHCHAAADPEDPAGVTAADGQPAGTGEPSFAA